MDQSNSQFMGCLGLSRTLSPKNAPFHSGIVTPFSRFCTGPKCYTVQCIVNGEENPQNCPLPWGFRHPAGAGPSHGHRQHLQKLVKIARVVPEISSRTDRHAQTRSSQYFKLHPRAKWNTDCVVELTCMSLLTLLWFISGYKSLFSDILHNKQHVSNRYLQGITEIK